MKLRSHQLDGVEAAMPFDGFALYMEQRTGKTLTALKIVERRRAKRLLIECPKKAIRVWETALREAKWSHQVETRLVNYSQAWGLKKQLRRWNPDFVIADESHRVKKPRGRHSLGLRYAAKHARWRLALTGTPLDGKHIEQAWAQYDFIDPSVFGKWSNFKRRYLIYGGFRGKKIIGTRRMKEFREKLHSRFFRVLLDDISPKKADLPPPHVVSFPLVESLAAYRVMENKFILELNSGERIVAPRVLTQAMKLQQITGGFVLEADGTPHRIGNEKLEHCGALMLWLGHSPIVIIVRFLWELQRVAKLCRALKRTVTLVSGGHEFTSFETDVAIVQVQSGLAIDLARASEVIFYSMNYSYFDHDQAKFRIRSYEGTFARYHYLVAQGTVDEDIYTSQIEKLSLATLLIDRHRRSK